MDFYKENLGCEKDDIWKTGCELLFHYTKMNVFPNLKLDKVSKNIRKERISDAEKLLDEAKLGLIDFGKNYFQSVIYYLLEENKVLKTGSSENKGLLGNSYYMINFFEMRKKELEKNIEEASVLRNNLQDRDFFNKFGIEVKEYVRRKDEGEENRNPYSLKANTQVVGWFGLSLVSFPYNLLKHRAIAVCPYQRSRYYSEKIRNLKGENLDDSLHSSSLFKRLSMPNFWIDLCTPKELEMFNNSSDKEFEKIASHFNPELIF